MRKPINSTIPAELIGTLDELVENSHGEFKSRSHLVEQAIRSYVDRDSSLRAALLKTVDIFQDSGSASSLYETALFPRPSMRLPEKRAIAEQAARLVDTGQTLFIDGSTTCIHLARVLAERRKGLTVFTNSALICLELGLSKDNTVVGIGGQFDPASASLVGPTAEEAFEGLYFDLAIGSTKGFLPAEGTFESSAGTLRVKQAAACHCGGYILLVDHTKFGQRSLVLS